MAGSVAAAVHNLVFTHTTVSFGCHTYIVWLHFSGIILNYCA
jgi:hypothetical protein